MRRSAALTLALCWTGLSCSSPSPPPKPTDPCTLITTGDAAHALHTGRTEITHQVPAGRVGQGSLCVFQPAASYGNPFVSIGVERPVSRQQFLNRIDTALGASITPPGELRVNGLGDAAFAESNDLQVHRGDRLMTVQVATTGDFDFLLAQEKSLAAIALKRL